ncbi:MAG: Wzy polymerase domain-containing protein [Rhodoferax sp.]
MNSKLLSPFWLVSAAVALSFAWLLPNHSSPWVGFHGDAWAASILAIVGLWIVFRGKSEVKWHLLTLTIALFSLVPLFQYMAGQIPVWGTAWINSAYMLGFLFAIQSGERWELESPGQCADFLFTAILLASIVSVGIQFYQWLMPESPGLWTLFVQGRSRFYANMAQPNQLASLLLLGLVSCSWGFYRRRLNSVFSILFSIFLLTGIALTESRTAWVNLALLAGGAISWRKALPSKQYLWTTLSLGTYFILCVFFLSKFGDYFGGSAVGAYRSPIDDPRLGAWKMLFDASLHKPFFGFGWGQLANANFLVIENYPQQGGLFNQSHNLILDIILWNGYPLGLIAVSILGYWVFKVFTHPRDFKQIHLISFIAILGIHSMLEYPLHYAYFLLPFGIFVGAINTSLKIGVIGSKNTIFYLLICIISTITLAITIRDYFIVEKSFYGLRFENRKISTDIPSTPPNVIVLTQFYDYLKFARNIPQNNVKPDTLKWMSDTVNAMPSALVMYKLAENLAMNKQPDEAKKWLLRICKTTPDPNCQVMRGTWTTMALENTEIAAVSWPEDFLGISQAETGSASE